MYEFDTNHHQILYRMVMQYEHLDNSYNKIEYRLYSAGELLCINKNTLLFYPYSVMHIIT